MGYFLHINGQKNKKQEETIKTIFISKQRREAGICKFGRKWRNWEKWISLSGRECIRLLRKHPPSLQLLWYQCDTHNVCIRAHLYCNLRILHSLILFQFTGDLTRPSCGISARLMIYNSAAFVVWDQYKSVQILLHKRKRQRNRNFI